MRPLRPLILGIALVAVFTACTTAEDQTTTTATVTSTTVADTTSSTSTSTSTSTTTSPPPATTTTTVVERGTVEPAPIVATKRADLDGDGERERLRLFVEPKNVLLIGDVEVRLPFDVEPWKQLFIVDMDPDDGLREVALLRRFDRGYLGYEGTIHDLAIVAFVDGVAYVDQPARLYDMTDMISNGAVLNGEIKASSSNCLTTTSIHHVFGPLAKTVSREVTFSEAARDDPSCGTPDLWLDREADLDGDGVPEQIMLQGRRLFIGSAVQELPFPGQRGYSGDWSYLSIIDLDPSDTRREVVVAREAGEDHGEVLIVAYADGVAHSSGVLDIWSGIPDLSDGVVLNNRIRTASTFCAIATVTVHEFGPLAQVLVTRSTTTGTFDPDMCFG